MSGNAMKRVMLSFISAVLFLIIMNPFSGYAAEDCAEGRTFIMLGDSYGAGWTPDGLVKSWISYAKDDLGSDRVYSLAHGGEGYSSVGTGRRSFLDALMDVEKWIPDPAAVTDIIVVGGAADYGASAEASLRGLTIFMNYARAHFPNANVINGYCAGCSIPYYQDLMHKKYESTYVLFPQYGAYDIAEMAGVLDSRTDWFSSDHSHPYAAGEEAIANVLLNFIHTKRLVGGPQANGLYRSPQDGHWYAVRNGVADLSYTGLTYRSENDTWYYVQNGKLVWGVNAMVPYNGQTYYVENSTLGWDVTGFVSVGDNTYYLANSTLQKNQTGLVYRKSDDTWYYVANGVVQKDYTGLVYRAENDTWYYVQNGRLVWGVNAMVPYNGQTYYVENSTLGWDVTGFVSVGDNTYYLANSTLQKNQTGLVYRKSDDTWYYVANGVVQKDYTGLVYRAENDTWYYVQNGRLIWGVNAMVSYNGQTYYVENSTLGWDVTGFVSVGDNTYYLANSTLQKNQTGLVHRKSDDTWYYVANGVVQKDYTGLVYRAENDTWYYVQNGKLIWGVNAMVPYNGQVYYIQNSTLIWGVNGTVVVGTESYYVRNSTLVYESGVSAGN